MNFFIGIFQIFWLQISEHLFSRTPLKWLLLQRHVQDFVKMALFVNIINGLKSLTIFTKKLHLRCFTRFCVCLWSEVTSSIYQTYKFKVYYHWCRFCMHKLNFMLAQRCNVIKKFELLCDCMFATNTKTISYIT